jgi:hypothetical protein
LSFSGLPHAGDRPMHVGVCLILDLLWDQSAKLENKRKYPASVGAWRARMHVGDAAVGDPGGETRAGRRYTKGKSPAPMP